MERENANRMVYLAGHIYNDIHAPCQGFGFGFGRGIWRSGG